MFWDGSTLRKFGECALPSLLNTGNGTVLGAGLRKKYRSRIQIFDGQAS